MSEYFGSDGTIATHFEYDPFGNTTVNTDATGLFAYRFSTKPVDPETGLYYYGYRIYDPVNGRWPSRDPIEEKGGLNLYGFVGNDGVDRGDFLGRAGLGYGADAVRSWGGDYGNGDGTPPVTTPTPPSPPSDIQDGCPEGKIRDRECVAKATRKAGKGMMDTAKGSMPNGSDGSSLARALHFFANMIDMEKRLKDLNKEIADDISKCPCVCP